MSHFSRFAKEYSESPGRGYGSGVIQVLKKLSSPHLHDVYQPARDQFNGRGSFGNGGAMRAAPFALAFPDLTDVKRVGSDHEYFVPTIQNFKTKLMLLPMKRHHWTRVPEFLVLHFLCSLPVWEPC